LFRSQGETVVWNPARKNPLLKKKIAALRKQLGLNQHAFGAMFGGFSHMSVSRWESGTDQPDPEQLIKMARAALPEDKWSFLEAAGIGKTELAEIVRDAAQQTPVNVSVNQPPGANPGRFAKRAADAVAVRVLNDPAAAGQPLFINDKDVASILLVPNSKEFAPHPDGLIAVRVKGDSMSPTLLDGYIVVVDTADNRRDALYDEMVAACDPEGAVTIKWLRKAGTQELLLAQHTSPRYEPIVITGNDDWKIIGKVVWWVGRPSK
jgi:SOS-response transcriptional repressor LexA